MLLFQSFLPLFTVPTKLGTAESSHAVYHRTPTLLIDGPDRNFNIL